MRGNAAAQIRRMLLLASRQGRRSQYKRSRCKVVDKDVGWAPPQNQPWRYKAGVGGGSPILLHLSFLWPLSQLLYMLLQSPPQPPLRFQGLCRTTIWSSISNRRHRRRRLRHRHHRPQHLSGQYLGTYFHQPRLSTWIQSLWRGP